MATITHIEQIGNSFKLYYDDGSTAQAIPTQGSIWLVSGTGGGPGPGNGQFSLPFDWSTVSSEYGPRTGGVGSFHEGTDYSGGAAVTGAKIYATADGAVELVNINSNYGFSIQMYHGVDENGFGLHTIYAHFNAQPLVADGQNVNKGTVLGYLGESGGAQGPHLHYETHTCPNNGPVVHNTTNTGTGIGIRTAINPRDFLATYGDGVVMPQ